MTSRERILNCIYRRPTDRTPISLYELCGFDEDSWAYKEPSYAKLMRVIREETDCILMADPGYIDKQTTMHSSSERTGVSLITDTEWVTPRGTFHRRIRQDDNIITTWTLEPFLKSQEDVEKLLSFDWDPPEVEMAYFQEKKKRLGDNGVMMMTLSDPVCQAAELMGMDEFLVLAISEPDFMTCFLDMLYERQLETLKRICRQDVQDVIFRICGPEYCTPPYLPPRLFTRYVTRYIKEYCAVIHAAGGISRVHSHGKVRLVLDDIVETGAMCVDPLEAPPDGDIGLAEVKEKYGDSLILFGNIQLKDLENKTREEVCEITRQAMTDGAPGGGFILMPTATPINIPLRPETERNILAMIETAHVFSL